MNKRSNHNLGGSFKILLTLLLIGLVSQFADAQLRPSDGLAQRRSRPALPATTAANQPLVSISNLHFQSTDYTAGGDAYDIASGDFNGDGYPDVVTANDQGVSTVSVFLNNGNGSWQPHVDYTVSAGSLQAVAVGDFNGDGKLDIAALSITNGENQVGILLGNGDGTFQPVVISPAGGGSGYFAHSLAAGDFNHDGKADLAVTLYQLENGSAGLAVLLSNGNGTFQPPVTYPVASGALGIAVADLNRDGKLDLAVSTWCYICGSNDVVSILLGNGDGTFRPHVDYQVDFEPDGISVSDFNGDGKLDLAVANDCGTDMYCQGGPGTVSILLGNGDGSFQPQRDYTVDEPLGRTAVADFNGDGKRDIAVGGPYEYAVTLMLGNGDGTFQTREFSTGSHQAAGVVAGQFNSGGFTSADMVLADWDSYGGNTVTVMLNEAGTHTTLASSPNPSNNGQAVTFTVTVSPAVQGTGTPTGTVTFYNGASSTAGPTAQHGLLGSATLVNGVATFQYSNLPHGSNWITALYAGDAHFNPNSPRGLVQVVH